VTLAFDILPLDSGHRLLGKSLLGVLHDLGSLNSGDFLTEAEVESLEHEQPLQMPALTLTTGLGLHGLELGLPLCESGLFLGLFLVRAETLNWGMDLRRCRFTRHAVRTEDALELLTMFLNIIETSRTRHHRTSLWIT
jgi:hypothetical protein